MQSQRFSKLGTAIRALVVSSVLAVAAQGQSTYYVATTGNDTSGNGSTALPWATLTKAIKAIPDDGSTVLVRNGKYAGRIRMDRKFTQKAIFRAENYGKAKLENPSNSEAVLTVYGGANFELAGFEIMRPGASATGDTLVHISGADGITLRENILHDSYNNDLVKINAGAKRISVLGNVFYNQTGHDEHIDINGVTDVEVRGNIFFNDFAGSNRTVRNDTNSFVIVKNSSGQPFAGRITIARNIFLNWQGNDGSQILRIGEDGKPFFEAEQVMVENNLFLGNAGNECAGVFGVFGSRDITFRNNTVVGNLPGRAYAAILGRSGQNLPNENVAFYNNVWSDPTGTMQDFADGLASTSVGVRSDNNLYWNNGLPIPVDGDVLQFAMDIRPTVGNPLLPNQGTIVLPRWGGSTFRSGSRTMRDEFERLVRMYGTPLPGSAVLGKSDPAQTPADDILGKPRPALASLGAVEPGTTTAVGVLLAPASVTSGSITSDHQIVLPAAAPAGGAVVSLTSSNPAVVTVPANVTVPEGATNATFTATANAVGGPTMVNVTANAAGATGTATLTVTAPTVTSLTLGVSSFVMGQANSTNTITLSGPAPASGLRVSLTASPGSLSLPSSVTVPGGATATTFAMTARSVTEDTWVNVTATSGGGSATDKVLVRKLVMYSMSVPESLVSGATGLGRINLVGPALGSGFTVNLRSANAAITVPATVVVPTGQTTVTFPVTARTVTAATNVTVTATQSTQVKTDVVVVQPN